MKGESKLIKYALAAFVVLAALAWLADGFGLPEHNKPHDEASHGLVEGE